MNKRKHTIYIITNTETNLQYIGQTCNLAKRITAHKRCNDDTYLHRAIKKYGWEKFRIEVLCIVEESMVDEVEKKCISVFNTLSPNGYNISIGGCYAKAFKNPASEDLKQKLKRAYKPSALRTERMKEAYRNKIYTPEERLAQSLKTKGRKKTPEQIKAMSERAKGKKMPPRTAEHMEAIRKAKEVKKYGRPVSDNINLELFNTI